MNIFYLNTIRKPEREISFFQFRIQAIQENVDVAS